MKKIYTDEEMLMRIMARDEVMDLMCRRTYLKANEQRRRELDELWVQELGHRATASFGKNWGFYVGMDSIANYYVVKHEEDLQKYLDHYCATRPDIKNERENLGYGYSSLNPVSAPSIQVAGDCRTVKGLWYSVGYQNIPQADGSIQARWVAQKIAGDFILEKGGWKLWHLLEISDEAWEPGIDFHENMPVFEQENDILKVEFGNPDIPVQTHDRQFCWADQYPFMPKPYETFSDDISWGPEGFKPFPPSVRAREVILAKPTQPVGLSSCGRPADEEA